MRLGVSVVVGLGDVVGGEEAATKTTRQFVSTIEHVSNFCLIILLQRNKLYFGSQVHLQHQKLMTTSVLFQDLEIAEKIKKQFEKLVFVVFLLHLNGILKEQTLFNFAATNTQLRTLRLYHALHIETPYLSLENPQIQMHF